MRGRREALKKYLKSLSLKHCKNMEDNAIIYYHAMKKKQCKKRQVGERFEE